MNILKMPSAVKKKRIAVLGSRSVGEYLQIG
jgi:hypothetical protein